MCNWKATQRESRRSILIVFVFNSDCYYVIHLHLRWHTNDFGTYWVFLSILVILEMISFQLKPKFVFTLMYNYTTDYTKNTYMYSTLIFVTLRLALPTSIPVITTDSAIAFKYVTWLIKTRLTQVGAVKTKIAICTF